MTNVNTVPVIPGFWSDPTVCRDGDTFVLANSSFEYFPGAPVHVSTDLLRWRQVGNVITRPEQADLSSGAPSSGIYGSTIRHHDGRYWFITTNIAQVREGQLLYWADRPEGPWSDGVFLSGVMGIDPDICWDADGTCYVTWCAFHGGIRQVQVDPETGEVLTEAVVLWHGTGLAHPEGPHLYHVGDWWYLLIAEGGTHLGHAVSIARSRSPQGPYEPHPANPIFSHRSQPHPVQGVGHADLVEGHDGQWWAVYHGIRPKGENPHYHLIGREALVSRVDWVDGWPVFAEADLGVRAETSFVTDFSAGLGPNWVVPAGSMRGVEVGPDGVVLTAGDRETVLLTRVQDLDWSASAVIDVSEGVARLVVRIDPEHWYGVQADGDQVSAEARIGPLRQSLATGAAVAPVDQPGCVALTISAATPPPREGGWPAKEPDLVDLDGLVEIDGRYVSTEVAGGFTGRMVGVEVVSGRVTVRSFAYDGRDGSGGAGT
jgi:hypothetical protein